MGAKHRVAIAAVAWVTWACGRDRGATAADGGIEVSATVGGATTSETADGGSDGPRGNESSTADGGEDAVAFDLGGSPLDLGERPTTTCGCEHGRSDILLLADDGVLWSYVPAGHVFTELGPVACPVFSSSAFSLALDHRGTALVEYEATADLFAVDVATPTCSDPGYQPPPQEPRRFGLGWVGTDDPDACERLLGWSYAGDGWGEGAGIGTLVEFRGDPPLPQPLAPLDYDGGELTATADGRVFALAGAPGAKLLELDLDDGSVVASSPLGGVALGDAFAIAFWGGDLHLFVQRDDGAPHSRVLRVDADLEQPVVVDVETAPLLVVGAASSTCAPLTPAG